MNISEALIAKAIETLESMLYDAYRGVDTMRSEEAYLKANHSSELKVIEQLRAGTVSEKLVEDVIYYLNGLMQTEYDRAATCRSYDKFLSMYHSSTLELIKELEALK